MISSDGRRNITPITITNKNADTYWFPRMVTSSCRRHVMDSVVGVRDPVFRNPSGRDAPQEDDGASTWRGTTAAFPSRVWDEWS